MLGKIDTSHQRDQLRGPEKPDSIGNGEVDCLKEASTLCIESDDDMPLDQLAKSC
jgi:hypothetical protein